MAQNSPSIQSDFKLPPGYSSVYVYPKSSVFDMGYRTQIAIRDSDHERVLIESYHWEADHFGNLFGGFKELEKRLNLLSAINHPSVSQFISKIQTESGIFYISQCLKCQAICLNKYQPESNRAIWSIFSQITDILVDLKKSHSWLKNIHINSYIYTTPGKKLDKVGQPLNTKTNYNTNELSQKGCPTLSGFCVSPTKPSLVKLDFYPSPSEKELLISLAETLLEWLMWYDDKCDFTFDRRLIHWLEAIGQSNFFRNIYDLDTAQKKLQKIKFNS